MFLMKIAEQQPHGSTTKSITRRTVLQGASAAALVGSTKRETPSPFFSAASALWENTRYTLSSRFAAHRNCRLTGRNLVLTGYPVTGRSSPPTDRPHVTGMSFMTECLKPVTPSRNLLLEPYILWQRDSGPLPTAGVYSGHLSSQGLQVQTLKPGEAHSCNPLLQSF